MTSESGNSPVLESSSIVPALLKLLWVRLWLSAVSVLFSLIELILPALYGAVALLDGLIALATVVIILVTTIMALVWVFRIHQDLNRLHNDYPITPGGSLRQFMIPVYNVWGIWNTLSTLAKHFNRKPTSASSGATIQTFLPWFYGIGVLSNILARTIFQQMRQNPEQTMPVLYVLSALADLALSYLLIQLAQAMAAGMKTETEKESF